MINPNILPQMAGGQASATGEMAFDQVAELQKALTADYGTDANNLTGGGALRIQSLERTMMATIQENKHFRLFNALRKTSAGATVDEWTEQSSIGGFLGGSTNSETGTIAAAQGSYARRTGMVKYLMTRREVSLVVTLQNALAEAEAVEQQAGALQLLTDAEFLCFEGDSTVVPTEFDGIYAQIAAGVAAGQVGSDHIINADGASLNSINALNDAAKVIAGYGNFGTPTDIYMPLSVQADFDSGLDPAFRVALDNAPNSIMLGTPVRGIRTSHGDIATNPNVFLKDGDHQASVPFEVALPTLAAANAGMQPTIAVDASQNDTGSKFSAARAGNYYYLVAGVNQNGQSTGVVSGQIAIAAGKKAVLTITKSAGGLETGYAIYRSRQNGTNSPSDFRLITRVTRTGVTTTFTDNNSDIPGTAKAYVLNLMPSAMAITWRQLLPMLKFPLYPTVSATIPWAQLMFGYLRIGKRKHHAIIKNIVPNGAQWRPHG
jgi:hypothetical protein